MSLRSTLALATGALVLAAIAATAAAQAPPLKPGLWEFHIGRDGDDKSGDKRMAAAAEKLKTLPPDLRAKIEAQMKEQGIGLAADGSMSRICMNKDSFDVDHLQNRASSNCKTDFGTRTSSAWKWHSVCTQPPSESDGEAIFNSPESYVVTITGKRTGSGGEATPSRLTMRGKWLATSCGDMKPFSAQR